MNVDNNTFNPFSNTLPKVSMDVEHRDSRGQAITMPVAGVGMGNRCGRHLPEGGGPDYDYCVVNNNHIDAFSAIVGRVTTGVTRWNMVNRSQVLSFSEVVLTPADFSLFFYIGMYLVYVVRGFCRRRADHKAFKKVLGTVEWNRRFVSVAEYRNSRPRGRRLNDRRRRQHINGGKNIIVPIVLEAIEEEEEKRVKFNEELCAYKEIEPVDTATNNEWLDNLERRCYREYKESQYLWRGAIRKGALVAAEEAYQKLGHRLGWKGLKKRRLYIKKGRKSPGRRLLFHRKNTHTKNSSMMKSQFLYEAHSASWAAYNLVSESGFEWEQVGKGCWSRKHPVQIVELATVAEPIAEPDVEPVPVAELAADTEPAPVPTLRRSARLAAKRGRRLDGGDGRNEQPNEQELGTDCASTNRVVLRRSARLAAKRLAACVERGGIG